jgi:hypothetical protein
MATFKFTCTYCNYIWELSFKQHSPRCVKCKDKNIKCEEIKKNSYYEDDPEKETDDRDIYWRD